MAKQLNVNLGFTADTSQAKAQLQDLQKQLTNLTKMQGVSSKNFGFTDELYKATEAAAQLKVQLEQATDVNTGKLDLSKFNDSLQKSGVKLADYRDILISLGPQGEKAFQSLVTSIQSADAPVKRVNARLQEMKTTLENTVRWQVSSSLLHGFMGEVQSAYGYVQDLNKSLNNIRIVTGYSSDEMAQFADQANKAAKALSTTTVEYTDAALIYYQQGLTAEEVQKRTDVTIKMANVARQSAEVVSDQMTAVWNNFYDGTKSLEYYADVMTALGAKTASSTDEIAGGLEKFAAIGNTIGLSFDYAAAALATITSNTRQSEDVVGTALKTIFARIQGLNLGETLDDGTTLNKYSEALQKVGINIFDQAGELKTMDAILDEMGSKWNTLNSAQQTALAQTVAGVRQYTQLIALMENWNSGDNDSFQANLSTVNTSSGALQEQADIYAESWEAASDRVRAAAEGIYQDLLDDDFFVTLLNGFEGIVTYIDNVIDSMGGLGGVITTIGTIFLRVFGKDIAQALQNFGYNIKVNLGLAQEETAKLKKEAATAMSNFGRDLDTQQGYATQNAYKIQGDLQQEFLENASKMNEYEKAIAQTMLDGVAALGEQAIAQGQVADKAQQSLDILKEEYLIRQKSRGKDIRKEAIDNFTNQLSEIGKIEIAAKKLKQTLTSSLKDIGNEGEQTTVTLSQGFKNTFQRLSESLGDAGFSDFEIDGKNAIDTINNYLNKLSKNGDGTFEGAKADLIELEKLLLSLLNKMPSETANIIKDFIPQGASEKTREEILGMSTAALEAGRSFERAAQTGDELSNTGKRVGDGFRQASGDTIKFSEGIIRVADTLGSVTMVINTLRGAMDTIKDPDMSGWEKFLSIMGSVSMTIPMVATSFSNLTPLLKQGASRFQDAAKGASAVGSTGGTAATAIKAIGVAIKGMMGPVGWTIIALTAVAAAITGIAIAANKAYNADANAAKEAAKRAQELAEAHEEVKQKIDAIYGAFDNYDRAVEALNACTKGTEEWRDALDQVNQSALDLLNTYPELLKDRDLFVREDGMLKVNPKARDQLEKDLEQQERNAQAASLFGQTEATEKSLQSQRTNLSRQLGSFYDETKDIVLNNINKLEGLTSKEEYEKVVKDLLGDKYFTTDEGASFISSSEGPATFFDDFIKSLMDCEYEINAFAKATKDYAQEVQNVSTVLVEEQLGDKYSKDVKNIAARRLSAKEEELENTYLNDIKGIDQTGANYSNNTKVKELWDKFNAANGTNLKAADNTIRGNGDNRQFAYIDSVTGEEKTFSAEYVASIIAASEALSKLEGMAQEAAEVLARMRTDYGQGVTEAVSNFIDTGSFNSANQDELNDLSKIKDLRELFPTLEDEQIAELFGVKTYEEAVKKFRQGIIDSQDALNTAGDNLTKTTKKIYDDLDEEMTKLSADDRQIFSKYLNEAFVNAGSDGAKIFADAFKKANIEEEESFIDAISSIDWNTADVDSLRQTLQDCGVATIYTDKELQQLIDTMNSAESLTAESAIENYNKLHSIVNGLQSGDTISEDQYAEMAKLGLEDYFAYMADGTYKLTGDAKELYNIVNKSSIDPMIDMINGLKEQKDIIQNLINNPEAIFGFTIRSDSISSRLDLISSIGAENFGFEQEQLVQWQEDLKNGVFGWDSFKEMSAGIDDWVNRIGGAEEALNQLTGAMVENETTSRMMEEAYASTANNVFELAQITWSFDENSEQVYQKLFDQITTADLSNLESAIDTLIQGGELSPELSEYLSKLEEQWPQLAEAARQGSREYVKALQEIEQEVSTLRVEKLMQEKQEIVIDLSADPKELQNTLDEIANKDYEIEIEIKTQLERELQHAINLSNQLSAVASKIGDNFIVAGEDIQSVVEMFPGILEGYTQYADGRIQLDKETAIAAIESAKQEAIGTRMSVAEKLQAEADYQGARAEIYGRIAESARQLASGEVTNAYDSAKIRGNIERDLSTVKDLEAAHRLDTANQEATGETQYADDIESAYDETYKNTESNAVSGYNGAANASASSASAQIHNARLIAQANRAAAEGNPAGVPSEGAVRGGTAKSSYTGTTQESTVETYDMKPSIANKGKNKEDPFAVSIDGYIGADSSLSQKGAENLAKWAEEQQAAALAAQEEALAAMLAAKDMSDINTTFDNVISGLGSDGKRDGGGGGGSSKKEDEEKAERLEDQLDVYADIDAQIEEINNKLEAQKKITEHSEGEEKLASLKKEKELLDQLNGKYAEKLDLAKRTLVEQKRLLMEKAPGLEFSGDTILNQVETLQGYKEQINALADMIDNETDAAAKTALQAQQADLMKQYEIIFDLLEQYKETLALLREIEGTITDNNYDSQGKLTTDEGGLPDGDAQQALENIQKENYERLTKQLEINLSFDENQLKLIEQYLEQIADDFYQMGEAAALTSSKVGNLTGKLSSYENFYNSLQGANISQEDLIAGMQESADGIMATLDELIALDKEMMNFYSDTLDAAADELSYFTDQLSHHTEVLDHYRSIVELINGEFDYESIGIILQGATITTKNEMDAAMANYQMLLSEKAALEASLAMAPDEAARELYEKELRAITEACNEAESEMLDKTEAWAKAMKAVLENTMNEAAHEMEMALTNGMTFNALNSSLDRLSSYADEYLTKTNQIYETQKLINTTQQAIDKTTNNAAKARLKSYQDEINALQQKNQLSQLELEIAKAQYDVLLAEIALEEAQNAKATVRLQRDSEGNYGYVYTADQEQVSQAEQDLLDAQNALYNIGLEGANDYGQKMLELKEQLANDLIDLEERRAQGEFETLEAYEAERDRILQEYYDLYTAYSEQYTTALGVDASIQEEAWVNAYENMITTTDDWKTAVAGYTKECEQAYTEWRQTVQTESETIDSILNHTEQEVKDVTNASNDLKNKVVNEVIPAIQNELQQVRAATSAYANQRAAIQQLISYYQQLAQAIYAAAAAQSAMAAASSSTSSGGGSSSSSAGDANYAALMYEAYQANRMDEYEYYKNLREQKIASTGNDYGVSTDRLDDYITSGGDPDSNGWFTDEWLKKNGSLGTGGYTGAWGPEGRLALVHEKELMLNPDDTVNFLSGIEILRNISKSIDLNSMRNHAPIYSTMPIYDTMPIKEALEQQVSIQASFPAVTDRHEIEEAFNNLINTASQFANRKKL